MHLSELLVHENHNYAFWFFAVPPVWRRRRRRLVVRPGPVCGIVSCVFCSTKLQNCADFVRLCVPCCLSELGAQNEASQAADSARGLSRATRSGSTINPMLKKVATHPYIDSWSKTKVQLFSMVYIIIHVLFVYRIQLEHLHIEHINPTIIEL